ncbi:MAG: R-phenyllactate dehydratase activator [Actinobacteria bacterium ADurb.BinA094]|nr:MAG: R-phenyllactate dehydratase activator [Actinobacteria bacterium ADurb.BinA094]
MTTLGIDIGCISLKAALVGQADDQDLFRDLLASHAHLFQAPRDGLTLVGDAPLLVARYRRIKGSPTEAVEALLAELLAVLPDGSVSGARVTGSGGRLVGAALEASFENEFKAIARGVAALHPETQTVFEMGGETSKFIRLEVDDRGCAGIIDYQTNGDCAAGTGSFMDQQASRLLYDIEDVGDIVLDAGKAASIAGRCSVFAKSDMIHAQQKGYQPPEVLRGLCDAVMRNFKGTIAKGKIIQAPVAFIGGVAANAGAVRSLREAFSLDGDRLFIPEYHTSMGAIGAALLEADLRAAREQAVTGLDVERLPAADFPVAEPLSMDRVIQLSDMARPYEFADDDSVVDVYMGIDVGSVSTNLVVVDDAGEVLKEIYVKTDARPVEVVNKGLAEIRDEIGYRINLRGVGTTGSGRELIGELTGADIVTDEITAHKTGADFIGRKIGRRCDTIFEIGGQDSKYISVQDGIVVDFAMNEACAAGTGSFLEEQAEKLGIDIIGEFAELALGSRAPIRLGERCTVFMERDVMAYQQRGARRDDLVAGLALSIVTNYLNRLVRDRHVGDVIFFQGGTAYNDSVAAAFTQVLDKEIIVPPHNGVMGALGMALLARERVQRTGEPTTFRGWDLEQVDYTVLDFVCKGCSNECDVRQFTIEGEKTYWGDKCSDRYRKPAKVDKEPVIEDLIAFREQALMAPYEAARARVPESAPTVGLARAMYNYDRLPFWSAFFAELGLRPVLSPESDKQIREAGVALTVAEPCFPIRVAHGHVQWLLREGVDWVFMPNQVNEETEFEQYNSHACPWGQTLPFVVKAAPGIEPEKEKILYPRVRFRDGREGLLRDFSETAARLGVSRSRVRRAFDAAYAAQDAFRAELREAGARALERLELAGELGIVLVGRPYNMFDKGVNMDIPRKLRKFYGVNVIPLDFLPIRGIDIDPIVPNMFWNYGRKILQAATYVRGHDHLHLIYMTNFKCGPDSYIKHYVREASGKPFLSLQFDEHQNDAGAMTRCEAYLDSKGFLRWWSQEAADEARACREELAGAV